MRNILFFEKAISVLVIVTLSITPQAAIISINKAEMRNNAYGGGTTFTWEDDFLDESKIDAAMSYSYVVEKTTGKVLMKDTYKAWYNKSWTRMKEINVINGGNKTYNEYVLDLLVYYDSDMQQDFRDLRFTDGDGNDLYYWIGEKINGQSANVLVRVPYLPPGETTIYMFYGDRNAIDNSNFDIIFTWEDRTDPDIMISYKNYLEGAWDPDVAFGSDKFLVAWEEGLGPEELPFQGHRLVSRQIHGRLYDSDGKNPYPKPEDDLDIYISSDQADTSYHAENPTIAYGGGKFFVAWEENKISNGRWAVDIKGALVATDGTIVKRFTICDANLGQYDPCVAYGNNRFFVTWEDARDSTNNYDVYGRIFDTNGNALTTAFQVAGGPNYQGEPWICSDDQGNFMVVYEDGYNPATGPFSLYAQRLDSNGNKIGLKITIAQGSENIDNIFPSVVYNQQTQRYFVAWNDGDISVDPNSRSSYDGNIWGKILDKYGNVVKDNFIVQAGTQYIRTDVVSYLDTLFFISYDGGSDLWGCLSTSDGSAKTNPKKLSDGSSQQVDWNNLAVGNGKIFAVWEDERDQASEYPDAFGSVWYIYRSTGSPDVTYSFGEEKQIITEAVVVSTVIVPDDGFVRWEKFDAKYSLPIGNVKFDILNAQGTQVLMHDINPGRDISIIKETNIRLRCTLSREVPKDSPTLDWWCVSWIGADKDPPWTDYEILPAQPNGRNGWYTVSVEVHFEAHDDVSPSDRIVTYYIINDGQQNIYSKINPPKISTDGINKIEYWSVDEAGNEEQHHILEEIRIDRSNPNVIIETPKWGRVEPGDVKVSGNVGETTSGIEIVEIWFNGGKINENEIHLSPNKDYYEWHFTAEKSQVYDIEVWAYDFAGNVGKAYVTVKCPRAKIAPIFTKVHKFINLIPSIDLFIHRLSLYLKYNF